MSYLSLVYLHLLTVLPAFILGTYLMFSSKGAPLHRLIGKIYLALMGVTALITLWLPAKIGATLWGHFGWIHALSLLVLYTVPAAFFAAKNHNIGKHQSLMIQLYIGGLLVAGSLTLLPGRLLNGVFFGV